MSTVRHCVEISIKRSSRRSFPCSVCGERVHGEATVLLPGGESKRFDHAGHHGGGVWEGEHLDFNARLFALGLLSIVPVVDGKAMTMPLITAPPFVHRGVAFEGEATPVHRARAQGFKPLLITLSIPETPWGAHVATWTVDGVALSADLRPGSGKPDAFTVISDSVVDFEIDEEVVGGE